MATIHTNIETTTYSPLEQEVAWILVSLARGENPTKKAEEEEDHGTKVQQQENLRRSTRAPQLPRSSNPSLPRRGFRSAFRGNSV